MYRLVAFLLLLGCAAVQSVSPGAEFVGVPYLESPLGEGDGYDNDPLIRFDAFDCTTFVETVVADGNVDKLNQIRYENGEVDFLKRNHFIESDWLNNNIKYVQNISAKFAPTQIRRVIIDKQAWLKKVHGISAEFQPEVIDLEYIPYKYVNNIVVTRPMIVLFVADNSKIRDKIGTDLAIVHMGFVLPNDVLRHASSSRREVVDVAWTEYIESKKQNKDNLGIVLVDIR